MGNKRKTKGYELDVAIHPGATLAEWLDENEMSSKEFARRIDKQESAVSNFISGRTSLTDDWAERLYRATGIDVEMWKALYKNYEETLARLEKKGKHGKAWEMWGALFPITDMVSNGWLPVALKSVDEKVEALFRFFGVNSHEAWENQYGNRISTENFRATGRCTRSPEAVSAWIRAGELQSQKLRLKAHFDRNMLEQAVTDFKALLINDKDAPHRLQAKCLEYGIKLVYVPSFAGISMSGLAMWAGEVPIIQLSCKGKSYDKFVFDFFHELGHIALHSRGTKGKETIFVDESDAQEGRDRRELEANNYAANKLIPEDAFSAFVNKKAPTLDFVRKFATENGVHPYVVVGRLAREGTISYATANTRYKSLLATAEIPQIEEL